MSKELEKMTPELRAFIEEWKAKPGNLIMVLHRVQQTYGYIPREIAIETSEILDVPLAKIYGVITFYNFFRLQKAGKYNIQVCLGTACYLRGGDDVLKEFEKQLGVGLNATTPDGMFSVEAVRPRAGGGRERRGARQALDEGRREHHREVLCGRLKGTRKWLSLHWQTCARCARRSRRRWRCATRPTRTCR